MLTVKITRELYDVNRLSCGGRIFYVKSFIVKWKWVIAALAAVIVLGCLFLLIGGSGWTIYRLLKVPSPTVEPKTFGYCGVNVKELCVVSFGQDVFGDTIINLYVPAMEYGDFYLKVIRRDTENEYECVRNKDFKTSVYCTGASINLGEGFGIQILSKKDGSLLAQGNFTLTAYLVTTPFEVATQTSKSGTASEAPTSTVETRSTPTPEEIFFDTATPTATKNQPAPYPNYP